MSASYCRIALNESNLLIFSKLCLISRSHVNNGEFQKLLLAQIFSFHFRDFYYATHDFFIDLHSFFWK